MNQIPVSNWDIAPNIVTEGTGPLPPDVFEIHRHALYCVDTVAAMRFLPQEQRALVHPKLAECAKVGRKILAPALPRIALLCSTNAHETAIVKAIEVAVRFQRGENVDGCLWGDEEYKRLRYELRREAVQLANDPKRKPQEIPPAGNEAQVEADTNKPRKLTGAVRLAYLSNQRAESFAERSLTDRKAYDWLSENDWQTGKTDAGELADYDLPEFNTWRRYVVEARRILNESRYETRSGRRGGKSIVKASEIEPPKKPSWR